MTDLELINDHFHRLIEREPRLTERFYDRFFGKHPELRELFGVHSFPTQRQMLMETLIGVIDNLGDEVWVQTNMSLLGEKHVEYGVLPETYGVWTDTMLEVLEELSQDDWSPQLAAVWRKEIDRISAIMCPDL